MGRKKTNATKPSTAKPNRSPAYAIFVRINPELGDALDKYLGQARPQPTTRAVIETALQDFLTFHGCWPPSADEGE